MNKKEHGNFSTRRIVLDAMLIALFFVLSSASLRLGNTFKITFDSLACLITAMLFGPLDAFLVGLSANSWHRCCRTALPQPRFCGCWRRRCAVLLWELA